MNGQGKAKKRSPGNRGKNMDEKKFSPEFLARQFQPGQSGNPSGRPRKCSDRVSAYWDKLRPGKKHQTYGEAVIESLYRAAIRGSVSAAQTIFEKIEGKTSLPVEMSGYLGNVPLSDLTDAEIDLIIKVYLEKKHAAEAEKTQE